MDDSARPGPSSESSSSRPRPRAVVLPNILEGDHVIQPLVGDILSYQQYSDLKDSGENPNVQVAVLNINEGGQYHLVRTGALIIDPREQARDPSSPVPVALPNGTSIVGIATVLPIELMHIMLPNVSERHHDMLLELEREEERICDLRWTVRDLEHASPTILTLRAWSRALRALDPEMGDRLPQALEYERYALIFNPRRHQYSPNSALELVLRRHRGSRRRRSYQTPTTDLPLPEFLDPVETCRIFLANILSMSSNRPPRLEKAIRLLVQLLIDDVLDSEQFCGRLERLLDAQPQPNVVRFLKKNLRALRQALYFNRATLEGIARPERRVAFSVPIPEPELPEYAPVRDTAPHLLPIAAVAPQQPIPLADIPYDLPLPLAPVHVSQVQKSGIPSLIRTVPREGDVHLYNPRVGYVHFQMTPTATSFQIGNTTVRLLQKEPNPPPRYSYDYGF